MSKNIVICLDGTWNNPGKRDSSNVELIFEHLKGAVDITEPDDEREISNQLDDQPCTQVAKYLFGVGSNQNLLGEYFQGITGYGLAAQIVRAYTFLSRHYVEGDNIYLIGFSRGAYAARSLAGLVASVGVLDWQAMGLSAGSAESYSAGFAAWKQYKKSRPNTSRKTAEQVSHVLSRWFSVFYDTFQSILHPAPTLKLIDNVKITGVGVWDTVGALGIPDIDLSTGNVADNDMFRFADMNLSNAVQYGFQAVAADEQRQLYEPTLWTPRENVTQVLFPGAHADVGGGEAEKGLSNCTLFWMKRKLSGVGVRFRDKPIPNQNPNDVLHQPWVTGPIKKPLGLRQFGSELAISQRIFDRLGKTSPVEEMPNPRPYRPQNLRNSYIAVDWSGPAPHVQVVS